MSIRRADSGRLPTACSLQYLQHGSSHSREPPGVASTRSLQVPCHSRQALQTIVSIDCFFSARDTRGLRQVSFYSPPEQAKTGNRAHRLTLTLARQGSAAMDRGAAGCAHVVGNFFLGWVDIHLTRSGHQPHRQPLAARICTLSLTFGGGAMLLRRHRSGAVFGDTSWLNPVCRLRVSSPASPFDLSNSLTACDVSGARAWRAQTAPRKRAVSAMAASAARAHLPLK